MTQSTDEISHALVWATHKKEIEVVTVEELCDFSAPEHKNDFVRNKFIKINRGKLPSIEAILLALGSETEMKGACTDAQLSTAITHALVNFLNREEIAVIPVENIQHFCENRPKHHFQYLEYTVYHGKTEDEDDYETIYIHALGDNDEMLMEFNKFKDNIHYALVRFIDDDSLQVVPIENIEKLNPTDRSDFNQWKVYRGRQNTNEEYNDIQILRLGCFPECSSFLDVYNSITHALVVFKPNNMKQVIPINYIQEFKKNPPDTAHDFNKNKPYSGRLTSSARYSAVQIFGLGHEQILNFNKISGTKRMHLKKFYSSDLGKCNKTVSDYNSSKTDSDSESETPQKSDEPSPKRHRNIKRKGKSPSQEPDPEHERRKSILLNSQRHNLPPQINYGEHDFDDDDEVLNTRIADHGIASTSTTATVQRNTSTLSQARNPLGPANKQSYKNSRANKPQKFTTRKEVIDDSSDEENNSRQLLFNQKQRYRKKIRKLRTFQRTSRATEAVYHEQIYKTDLERFRILTQDSDSDIGTTEELSVFQRFELDNGNAEEPVKYIHLDWSVNILYSDWKKVKADSKDEYSFISNLADAMFGKQILQLFLQIKPFMKVADQKPRREVTETELKIIKQCLKYWIRLKCPQLLQERTMHEILSTTRNILSNKISAEFKKYEQKKRGSVTYMKSTSFVRNPTTEN